MSLIDSYLERLEVDNKIREPNVYYVTELCRECQLSTYYNIKEEVPPTKKMLRIFHMGHVLEDVWVQAILKNTPGVQVLATQLPARVKTGEYEIHGRIDALTIEDNRLVIHECKTAKTASWKKAASPEHLMQLQFYLCALGVETGQVDYIDKTIMLLGEDPKNLELPPDTSYRVSKEPTDYIEILRRAYQLHTAVTTNTPPNPTESWLCGYCDHVEKCRRDYPAKTQTPNAEEANPTSS